MEAGAYKGLSDSELVALCLSGEAGAWEALIRKYRRLIFSIPVRFSLSSADASDVFQSVCVKLIENLHKLKDESKISAWLITTTTRQCIHLQAQRRRNVSQDEQADEPLDPHQSIESTSIDLERQQAVRESVESLQDRCRRLLQMLYFDPADPSYEEISRALGLPVSSIGPTRARCLDKLRTQIRRRGVSSY